MPPLRKQDHSFEIAFLKSIHRRDRKDCRVLEMLGDYLTKSGQIREGLRVDRRRVHLEPMNPVAHYNLACSYALDGKIELALQELINSLTLGYRDFAWIQKDPDLRSLHKDSRFEQILEVFQHNPPSTPSPANS